MQYVPFRRLFCRDFFIMGAVCICEEWRCYFLYRKVIPNTMHFMLQ